MKPTYSNDRKAPRMKKGEFSKMVVTKELYSRFKKANPEYKKMTWAEFYNTWHEIAERIRYHAIYNPFGVKMGSYTGELKLQYLPYKFLAKDHHTSEIEAEVKNYLNIESKSKVPKIKWERRWAVKFNRILQFYAFDETREINKLAFQYMEEGSASKLLVSRNTMGGQSVWRQKMKKYD